MRCDVKTYNFLPVLTAVSQLFTTKARHSLASHLTVPGQLRAVSGAASPPPGVSAHHRGVVAVVMEDLHLHEATVLTTLNLGTTDESELLVSRKSQQSAHLISNISGAFTESITGSDPITLIALERSLVMSSITPSHSHL